MPPIASLRKLGMGAGDSISISQMKYIILSASQIVNPCLSADRVNRKSEIMFPPVAWGDPVG